MAWTVYGDRYTSTGYNDFEMLQPVVMNKNAIIQYAKAWIIAYNDPTFTNMTMKIFAYNNAVKGKLLYSSTTTLTKAQIITLANGIKEVYFEFDNETLHKDNTYYFALGGSGAVFTASSHVAWKKAWPDPIYRTGTAMTYNSAGRDPYELYFIGSEL